jgi:hypothetical protein
MGLPVLAKKKISGRMLGCYILCSESLFEVDRLTDEVKGIKNKSKAKMVWPGKVKFEDIENKSN